MPFHDILTIAAALVAVLGMILLIRFGSRLAGFVTPRTNPGGALSLDASLLIDPKRRLCLIGCQGRQLLLLTGGTTDVLLGWLPDISTIKPPSS